MRVTVSDVATRHYRLSRVEYDRAVEAGAFEPDARLELVDGNLHAMTPEGTAHSTGMHLVADCLRHVFGSGFFVRIQNPLGVDEYSEPEPDVAVVTGTVQLAPMPGACVAGATRDHTNLRLHTRARPLERDATRRCAAPLRSPFSSTAISGRGRRAGCCRCAC